MWERVEADGATSRAFRGGEGGFTKRRNWEDLYVGDAFSYFSAGFYALVMLWGVLLVAALGLAVGEDGGWVVSGILAFGNCLWDPQVLSGVDVWSPCLLLGLVVFAKPYVCVLCDV